MRNFPHGDLRDCVNCRKPNNWNPRAAAANNHSKKQEGESAVAEKLLSVVKDIPNELARNKRIDKDSEKKVLTMNQLVDLVFQNLGEKLASACAKSMLKKKISEEERIALIDFFEKRKDISSQVCLKQLKEIK